MLPCYLPWDLASILLVKGTHAPSPSISVYFFPLGNTHTHTHKSPPARSTSRQKKENIIARRGPNSSGNMRVESIVTLLLALCSKSSFGQVELPELAYAQDALEPYISEEVGLGLLVLTASSLVLVGGEVRAGRFSQL